MNFNGNAISLNHISDGKGGYKTWKSATQDIPTGTGTPHDRKSYNVDILWNRQRKKEHTLPWLKTILIYRFFFPSQELSIQHIRDVSLNCPPDSLAYRVVVVFQDKLSWSSCRVTSQGALWKACPCYCTISSCLGFCKKRGAFIWGSHKKWSTLFLKEKRFHYFPGSMFVFFGM